MTRLLFRFSLGKNGACRFGAASEETLDYFIRLGGWDDEAMADAFIEEFPTVELSKAGYAACYVWLQEQVQGFLWDRGLYALIDYVFEWTPDSAFRNESMQ